MEQSGCEKCGLSPLPHSPNRRDRKVGAASVRRMGLSGVSAVSGQGGQPAFRLWSFQGELYFLAQGRIELGGRATELEKEGG